MTALSPFHIAFPVDDLEVHAGQDVAEAAVLGAAPGEPDGQQRVRRERAHRDPRVQRRQQEHRADAGGQLDHPGGGRPPGPAGDGPQEFHLVLLDNGRTRVLADEVGRQTLNCIRCSACLNICPVYERTGGHAYGSVYPGPIGAVLSPALAGVPEAGHLAQASTFCGRCDEVCPVEIPLVSLMRTWREAALAQPSSWRERAMLRSWAFVARRPRLYRLAVRAAVGVLAILARGRGRLTWLPLGARWTRDRDFPGPQGRTFQDQWARRSEEAGR